MKTLETKRLLLRAFKPSDLEDFHAYAKIPGVGEKAGWLHHKSLAETQTVLDAFMKQNEVYALELKENNRVIGSLGIHQRSDDTVSKEIGYVLSKTYWGQGYMTEAVKRVVAHCFEDLEQEKLYCGHFVENKASKRIIEKVGFTFLTTRKYYSKNMDQHFDECYYVLSKADYNSTKNV